MLIVFSKLLRITGYMEVKCAGPVLVLVLQAW